MTEHKGKPEPELGDVVEYEYRQFTHGNSAVQPYYTFMIEAVAMEKTDDGDWVLYPTLEWEEEWKQTHEKDVPYHSMGVHVDFDDVESNPRVERIIEVRDG